MEKPALPISIFFSMLHVDACLQLIPTQHHLSIRSHRREEEIDSLVRSGETFGDLLLKCGEGQSFYHDMSNRLHGLRDDLAQVNAALDDLEPSQHQQPPPPTAATASFIPPAIPGGATGVPPQHPYATTPPPTGKQFW